MQLSHSISSVTYEVAFLEGGNWSWRRLSVLPRVPGQRWKPLVSEPLCSACMIYIANYQHPLPAKYRRIQLTPVHTESPTPNIQSTQSPIFWWEVTITSETVFNLTPQIFTCWWRFQTSWGRRQAARTPVAPLWLVNPWWTMDPCLRPAAQSPKPTGHRWS